MFFIFLVIVELRNEKPLRSRRTTAEILRLLDEFHKGSLGVGEFCKVHGLHPANFHKWRSRHKEKLVKKPAKPSGFAPVKVQPVSTPASSSLFAEINGLKLYQPVSASYLKELLS